MGITSLLRMQKQQCAKTLNGPLASKILQRSHTEMQITRRELLKDGTVVLAGAAVGHLAYAHPGSVTPKFTSPLRIPQVLQPVRSDGATNYYEITQKEADLEIFPGKKTRVWGYNGMFPGPTIKAQRGRRVSVQHSNELSVHTVVHLNRSVTAPEFDGFPTDMVMPGSSRSYEYANQGRGTTLWYHDHAMDHTGRNTYMGLAGLY
jgi:FtsP/CotA-like multicopper oxidase with cupredoxin domain